MEEGGHGSRLWVAGQNHSARHAHAGHDSEDQWLWAPAACAVVLTAGAAAGVVRALRHSSAEQRCAALRRCGWPDTAGLADGCLERLTPGRRVVLWSLRFTACLSLISGVVGLLLIAPDELYQGGLESETVPTSLWVITIMTYLWLGVAILLSGCGLRWQVDPRAHFAFRQASRAALLGALTFGIFTEVLMTTGEKISHVPQEWRRGCGTLGFSSSLILLGLLAAQGEGTWQQESELAEPEEAEQEAVEGAKEPEAHLRLPTTLSSPVLPPFGAGAPQVITDAGMIKKRPSMLVGASGLAPEDAWAPGILEDARNAQLQGLRPPDGPQWFHLPAHPATTQPRIVPPGKDLARPLLPPAISASVLPGSQVIVSASQREALQ